MSKNKLTSWNDGLIKQSILDFLESSVESGPNFIKPEDRIASFDYDGTLSIEKPAPAQILYLVSTLIAKAEEYPHLKNKEPYKSIFEIEQNVKVISEEEKPRIVKLMAETYANWSYGQTPEEYEEDVTNFFQKVKQEKFGVCYTDLIYKPMLELFELLKEYEYRIFLCTGSGREFIRTISESVFNIPKENIIGTTEIYEYYNGGLRKVKEPFKQIVVGPGKVEHIFTRTGRLPAFAAGNSNGDIEMLEASEFKLLINHDDDKREYAYQTGAEKMLEVASENNYTVVSMKNDWKEIFNSKFS